MPAAVRAGYLRAMTMTAAGDDRRAQLLRAFRSGQGATDQLAQLGVDFLRERWGESLTLADVAREEVLHELLLNFPIFPVWLERTMTRVRYRLLLDAPSPATTRLAACVAIQCHLNEYAWAEHPIETALVDDLAADLSILTPDQAVALASYRPLARLPGADALLTQGMAGAGGRGAARADRHRPRGRGDRRWPADADPHPRRGLRGGALAV